MKWVTFYYDAMSDKIYDFIEHKDKASATEYFKNHYKHYFQLRTEIQVKLPMTYGYPFHKYAGITLYSFKKQFGDVEKYHESTIKNRIKRDSRKA
jgi:hypothetical protein